MQQATHFIEQYGSKEEYKKYDDKTYVKNTSCNRIEYLEGQLEQTEKCVTLQTVAVFKIKFKN